MLGFKHAFLEFGRADYEKELIEKRKEEILKLYNERLPEVKNKNLKYSSYEYDIDNFLYDMVKFIYIKENDVFQFVSDVPLVTSGKRVFSIDKEGVKIYTPKCDNENDRLIEQLNEIIAFLKDY